MSAPLRPIAVTVEESAPGVFVWRLLEHTDADWASLDVAARGSNSYAKAMASGLLALQALVDDLDAGPRDEVLIGAPPARDSPLARPFGFGTLK